MRRTKISILSLMLLASTSVMAIEAEPIISITSTKGTELCPDVDQKVGITYLSIANSDKNGDYTYTLKESSSKTFEKEKTNTSTVASIDKAILKELNIGTTYFCVFATNIEDFKSYSSDTIEVKVFNVLEPGQYNIDEFSQGIGMANIEVTGAKGSGNGELSYQWYIDDVAIADSINPSINKLTNESSKYTCKVTDGCATLPAVNSKGDAFVEYTVNKLQPGKIQFPEEKDNITICKWTSPSEDILNVISPSGASGEYSFLWTANKFNMSGEKIDTLPFTTESLTAENLSFIEDIDNAMWVDITRIVKDKQYPQYNEAKTSITVNLRNAYLNRKAEMVSDTVIRVGDVFILNDKEDTQSLSGTVSTEEYETLFTAEGLQKIKDNLYRFTKEGKKNIILETKTTELGCSTFDTIQTEIFPKETITKIDTFNIQVPVHDTTIITKKDTITLTKIDTIVKVDTINIKVPVHDTTTITKIDTVTLTKIDTITINKIDTIFKIDTIYVTDTVYIEVPETDITSKRTKVTLYPNPAVDYVNIDCEEPTAVALINENGNVLKRSESAYNHDLDITEYPTGIYFIKTEDAVFKFIKK